MYIYKINDNFNTDLNKNTTTVKKYNQNLKNDENFGNSGT